MKHREDPLLDNELMVSYISSINASQNYTNKSTIKSMKCAKMITRHSKRETLLGR